MKINMNGGLKQMIQNIIKMKFNYVQELIK